MKQPEKEFGRRGVESAAQTRSVPLPATSATTYGDDAIDRISAVSTKAHLGAEILAFVGLVVAFFATALAPADPLSLDALSGRIFIPEMFAGALTFDSPHVSSGKVLHSLRWLHANNLAILLLLVVGVASVWRRRYLLAGLVTAFFVFPWRFAGFELEGAGIFAAVLASVLVVRILRISNRKKLLLAAVAPVFGPLAFAVFSLPFIQLMAPPQDAGAQYYIVIAERLFENEKLPATGQDRLGDPIKRVASFELLPAESPSAIAAKAYVMAQEQALRGNPEGAAPQLEVAMNGAYPITPFDHRRLQAIDAFVRASGVFGEAAKGDTISNTRYFRFMSRMVTGLGILLAVFGLFSDKIASGMRARMTRIIQGRSKLQENAVDLAQTAGSPSSSHRLSMSADDGDSVLERIGARIRVYVLIAAGLAILAALAGYAWFRFSLPEPEANGAFDDVVILQKLRHFARSEGLLSPPAFASETLSTYAIYILVAVAIALGLILQRKLDLSRNWLAAIGLVAVVVYQTGMEAPDLSSSYAVRSEDISANTRQKLHIAAMSNATNPTADASGERPAAANARGLPTFAEAIGGSKSTKRQFESESAAFALAQIAYLEDRPDIASQYLGAVRDGHAFRYRNNRFRLAIINEWAETKGYRVRSPALRQETVELIGTIRTIKDYLKFAFLALVPLTALPLALGFFAFGRYRRIEALVESRRSSLLGKPIAA